MALRAPLSAPFSPKLGTWPIQSTRVRALFSHRFRDVAAPTVQQMHRSGNRPGAPNLRLTPNRLREAQVLIEESRRHDKRGLAALVDGRPPAPG